MAVTFSNILNIFATPVDVFQNLNDKPKWAVAFVLISVVSIGIGLLMLPLTKQAELAMLAQKVQKEQIEAAIDLSTRLKYMTLGFLPVMYLLRWLLVGAFLYFLSLVLGATDLQFKTIFAVVAHSEMVLILMGVVSVLILYIKGPGTIQNVLDLQAIVGCDYFLNDKTSNPPLYLLLNSINVFNIWYIATLGIGVSVVTSFNKLKSMILVTFVFFLGVGFQVVLTALTSNSAMGKGI